MSIQEVSAEQLAEPFHHYHEALGPDFGSSDESSHRTWKDVPQQNKKPMVAAARLALIEIGAAEENKGNHRQYFAKPGEAEWVLNQLQICFCRLGARS